MAFNIIVLAKQVPDTRNVGKDAMKADGTVNRGALPAIFNPEDLNALEQALGIKDQYPGTKITVLTMGPSRAAEILREGLFREPTMVSCSPIVLCRCRHAGYIVCIVDGYQEVG